MYGTIHMYGIVHVTVHDNVHIYGTMTWHNPECPKYFLFDGHDLLSVFIK